MSAGICTKRVLRTGDLVTTLGFEDWSEDMHEELTCYFMNRLQEFRVNEDPKLALDNFVIRVQIINKNSAYYHLISEDGLDEE